MATNKQDTLMTVSIELRDRIKAQADKEGRTMKGFLAIMFEEYMKKVKK